MDEGVKAKFWSRHTIVAVGERFDRFMGVIGAVLALVGLLIGTWGLYVGYHDAKIDHFVFLLICTITCQLIFVPIIWILIQLLLAMQKEARYQRAEIRRISRRYDNAQAASRFADTSALLRQLDEACSRLRTQITSILIEVAQGHRPLKGAFDATKKSRENELTSARDLYVSTLNSLCSTAVEVIQARRDTRTDPPVVSASIVMLTDDALEGDPNNPQGHPVVVPFCRPSGLPARRAEDNRLTKQRLPYTKCRIYDEIIQGLEFKVVSDVETYVREDGQRLDFQEPNVHTPRLWRSCLVVPIRGKQTHRRSDHHNGGRGRGTPANHSAESGSRRKLEISEVGFFCIDSTMPGYFDLNDRDHEYDKNVVTQLASHASTVISGFSLTEELETLVSELTLVSPDPQLNDG